MGFDTNHNLRSNEVPMGELLRDVQPEDLVHFGMIPEFIGRLPMVAVLDELSKSDLEYILQKTKNSLIKQYSKLFLMEGVRLKFTSNAISAVADKAIELKTGARALRSIMERIMLDVMYDLPQIENVDEVTINLAVVEGREKPVIKYKQAAEVNSEESEDSKDKEPDSPADAA